MPFDFLTKIQNLQFLGFLKIGFLVVLLLFIIFLLIVYIQVVSMDKIIKEARVSLVIKTLAAFQLIIAISLFILAIGIL